MLLRTARFLSVTITAFAACGFAQAQLTYTLTNLGTLGGSFSGSTNESSALGINNSGQIVGLSYTPARAQHAFLYQNGVMTDLATAYGTDFAQAEDINNSGQIVGGYQVSVSGGVRTTTTGFDASAVNASGLMVGTNVNNNLAATYSNGTMTTLGSLSGSLSAARGVNTAGKVVGNSLNSSSQFRAVLFNGAATPTDLGVLGTQSATKSAIAYDINDSDQIVGLAKNDAGFNHAFSYQNGVMTDLGTLDNKATTQSAALAINASGQIVGYSNNSLTGFQSAMLYQNGVMTDLSTLFSSLELQAAGFSYLTSASDINDSGQIVGYGRVFGGAASTYQAFLITVTGSPIPEPSSYAGLAGLAALGFALRRRRVSAA